MVESEDRITFARMQTTQSTAIVMSQCYSATPDLRDTAASAQTMVDDDRNLQANG